jgi:hypothetical protein
VPADKLNCTENFRPNHKSDKTALEADYGGERHGEHVRFDCALTTQSVSLKESADSWTEFSALRGLKESDYRRLFAKKLAGKADCLYHAPPLELSPATVCRKANPAK